jgi:hypothetical protein
VGLEYTSAKAPLPALGLVGRGSVLPNVAINFEVSGFTLPSAVPRYQAHYFDWDINGTVNLTNYVGLQLGWRRVSTMIDIADGGQHDGGDFRFQGVWFGAAARF